MKEAEQATTKTSFLTLSGPKITIVVTAIVPKTEGDYEVNDYLTLIFLSTFNRLNFHFQSIHSISPVLYNCGF